MTPEDMASGFLRPEEKKVSGLESGRTVWLSCWLLVFVFAFPGTNSAAVVFTVYAASLIAVFLVRRHLPVPWFISPALNTALLFWLIGILGRSLNDALSDAAGGGVKLSLPADQVDATANLFGGTAGLIILGYSLTRSFKMKSVHAIQQSPTSNLGVRRGQLSAIALASFLPALMIVYTLGPHILERAEYLAGRVANPAAVYGLGIELGVVAVAALAFVGGRWRSHASVVLITLAISLYVLIFLGLGSRRLALFPAVILIGAYAGNPGIRMRRAFFFTCLATVLVFPLPLYLRSVPVHGLLPYLDSMGGYFASLADLASIANNIFIAFPIAGYAAFAAPQIPSEYLWTVINPLPGQLTDWGEYSVVHRINSWTPFSMIGEIGNIGGIYFFLFWAFVGVVLGIIEVFIRRFWAYGRRVTAVAIVGLCFLFAILALQYNSRNSFRLLVYALVGCIIVSWIEKLFRRGATLKQQDFIRFRGSSYGDSRR